MSTIASPRPSMSSRRTSTSTTTDAASHPLAAPRRPRDRTALRDYYGLRTASTPSGTSTPAKSSLEIEREHPELDNPDFDAQNYVDTLLAKESIEGVLKAEAALVSDIRNLDGEKKALVYDNYSKLIAATDTTEKMREKMDPLAPTTSTLTPAIGHIAETATELRRMYAGRPAVNEREEQQKTVRWVLGAPQRLHVLMAEGNRDAAERMWRAVSILLDKWSGVRGVEEVQRACEEALRGGDS